MSRVKEIVVKVIASKPANDFIKKHHYSGKIVNNSVIHFGAFLDDRLHGVMSFGNSLDKRKMLGLVKGTLWNEFLELNRMAFDDVLPKYSESRCIAIAMKLIRKHYPHIKWVVSFADGTQCGDGTIYRASGFMLIGVHVNKNLAELPSGLQIHKMTLQSNPTQKLDYLGGRSYTDMLSGSMSWDKFLIMVNGKQLIGFQLKYIYFLHPNEKQNLTAPILPFSKIDGMNAGMYKGKKISLAERKFLCAESSKSECQTFQSEGGGELPTSALHFNGIIDAKN